MKVKLKHLGKMFIPMTSIDTKFWTKVKNVIGGMAIFNHYQIEEAHGLTISHVTQDDVPDGEYDLPLQIQDFFPEDRGVSLMEAM